MGSFYQCKVRGIRRLPDVGGAEEQTTGHVGGGDDGVADT